MVASAARKGQGRLLRIAGKLVAAISLGIGFAFAAFAREQFLDPDKAFRFSARALDERTIEARFAIADRYYLYREKFKFSVPADGAVNAEAIRLGVPVFPPGRIKFDETFQKDVEHYRNEVAVLIPILTGHRKGLAPTEPFVLHVVYQGCADAGLCYAPIEAQAKILPKRSVPGKRTAH